MGPTLYLVEFYMATPGEPTSWPCKIFASLEHAVEFVEAAHAVRWDEEDGPLPPLEHGYVPQEQSHVGVPFHRYDCFSEGDGYLIFVMQLAA